MPLRLRAGVVIAAWLAASSALGWPVEQYVDLDVGGEKFSRLSALEWVEVEDPRIATAERMGSGEVFLTGLAPGRTLLLLYAEGKFAVWRLRVAPKGGKVPATGGDFTRAAKACPGAELGAEKLVAKVPEETCRRALREFFEQDGLNARQLELTFEVKALQSQLAAFDSALPAPVRKKVSLRYVGAGLVAEGAMSESEHRQLLWTLFRQSLGRVALDDRVTLPSAR